MLTTPHRRDVPAATRALVDRSTTEESERAAAPEEPSSAAVIRRGPLSALSDLVAIAGGTFLGIAAGYYALNWFGGAQFNFLQLPLPFIAHTQAGRSPADFANAAPREVSTPPVGAPAYGNTGFAAPIDQQPAAPVQPPVVERPLASAPSKVDKSVVQASAVLPISPSAPPTTAKPVAAGPKAPTQQEPSRELTADDLDSALVAAQASMDNDKLALNRRGRPARGVTPDAFRQLCHLAEVTTRAALDAHDPRTSDLKRAVTQLLRDAAARDEGLADIGRLAALRLAADREGEGLVLAGTVKSASRQGRFYRVDLVLFGLPEEVAVLSLSPAPFAPHDRVLIAGVIIDQPRKALTGYTGDESLVIWGGLPLRLP